MGHAIVERMSKAFPFNPASGGAQKFNYFLVGLVALVFLQLGFLVLVFVV